ncbi:GntR family transcriptional regulator, partial [Mesorhizobium sp. M7A.F.Ca.CA.004.05.1.1]
MLRPTRQTNQDNNAALASKPIKTGPRVYEEIRRMAMD